VIVNAECFGHRRFSNISASILPFYCCGRRPIPGAAGNSAWLYALRFRCGIHKQLATSPDLFRENAMKWIKRAFAALALLVLGVCAVAVATALKAARPVAFQQLVVSDGSGSRFGVAVWYPTTASPRPTTLIGTRLMDVAPDGPIAGESLPLILISHGNGGGPASHADLAMALAAAGYIVAAPMHTGDNFLDQSALATPGWLAGRNRELSASIDYLLRDWAGRGRLDPGRIGAFGFSAGGYTVLAAAGARPDLGMIPDYCADQPEFACELLRQAKSPLLQAGASIPAAQPDRRIRAAVVAAPGLGFTLGGQALSQVAVPVQLWSAAGDLNVPEASNMRLVREGLGPHAEFNAVAGAHHMSFLMPCGPIGPPALCKDADGFDRKAFHARMNASVIEFFNRQLSAGPIPRSPPR
jgi:predicted dienelactone hydrolase